MMKINKVSMQELEQDLLRLKEIAIRHKAPGSPMAVTTALIDGVELPVFANIPSTLRDVYKLGLGAADNDFLIYNDERFTYGQTCALAADLACSLISRMQVCKGDRVAICSRNNPEWCIAYMAITMIGAVVVPMNSWWQGSEMVYGLQDSGARLLFADQERIDILQPFLEELDINIIAIKPDQTDSERWQEFSTLLDKGSVGENALRSHDERLDAIEVLPDDNASIMYTSGSTGYPKGVLSTHRAIISALYSWTFVKELNEILRPELVEQNPEFVPGILSNVPLFHVTGSHAQFLASFLNQRKFVMMYKWSAEKALELIEKERLSVLHGVPTMTWEVMNSPTFAQTDLRSLRSVQGGGASRPPEHLNMMIKKFPKAALPGLGYGLTETNAIAATITGTFYQAKPESTGRPTQPVTSVKIVDETGNTVPDGQIGEICIKGPTVMRGYWNKPAETAEVLKDGWFHSGDLGLFDEHGFLIIKDRAKDIVIRGGENIACAEVEYALATHPAVSEVAVYGLPDNRLGEIVAATIMIKPSASVCEQELQDFLKTRIAPFKIPAHIYIQTAQLERIASGKIAKKLIREATIKNLKAV
jgi:long-chain acyl-CoA synthetase